MKNNVVLITGGTSGIGRACALEFGKNGARIVITGRDAAKLKDTAAELAAADIEYRIVQGDIGILDDAIRAVADTITAFGRIDVLINNAGLSMRAKFADVDVKVLEQLMQTNFFGTVYITKAALPYLLASKGTIVGVSSIAGYRGLPGRTGYSASKFAMNGFLEALRTELLPQGVNVLTAAPGFTASNIRYTALLANGQSQSDTPRDEGKMMTSNEVAQHMRRAVEKRQRSFVLTSEGKLVVFLNKWLPGLMDKMVLSNFRKEEGEL
jgi:dehydrogenase/reductase SDR family protein 7B